MAVIYENGRAEIGKGISIHMGDIVKFGDNEIFTMNARFDVHPYTFDKIKAAYREFRIRETLAKIIKVSDVPPNCINLLPENSLSYIAEEAKSLLKLLSE